MDKIWIKDTIYRAICTMIEAFLGIVTVTENSVLDVDWRYTLMVCFSAGLVTVLKCVVVKLKSELSDTYDGDDDYEE